MAREPESLVLFQLREIRATLAEQTKESLDQLIDALKSRDINGDG